MGGFQGTRRRQRLQRVVALAVIVVTSASLGWFYQNDVLGGIMGQPAALPFTPQLLLVNCLLYDLVMRMRGSVWQDGRALDWRLSPSTETRLQGHLHRAYNGAFAHLLDIVIVAIDDATEEWLKSRQIPINPIPRTLYAEVLRRLRQAGAKVVAFDIHMDTPSLYGSADDTAFAQAAQSHGAVLLPCLLLKSGQDVSTQTPHPVLYDSVAGAGIINMSVDSDRVVRAATVAGRDAWGWRPSLGALAAGLWLGLTPDVVERQIARRQFQGRSLPTLPYVDQEPGFSGLPYQAVLLNFAGPEGSFRYVPMKVLLAPEEHGIADATLRRLFKGKLVFVGVTSKLAKDFFVTPFSATFPGVEIHATLAQMLLSRRFLHFIPLWMQRLLLLAMVLLTATLVFAVRPLFALPLTVLLAGACLYGALFALDRWLWVIPLAPLLASIAFVFAVSTAYLQFAVERHARHIRQRFQRFVAPAVLETMVAASEESLTRPRLVEATVLFSDLQGFTAISEARSPSEVAALLNEYFEAMTAVIDRYEGTTSKFIGDGIMVLFGVPVPQPDHAARAVRCAVAMQQAMERLRQRFQQRGLPELVMRIGVHTGPMVFGAIGSRRQMDLTVIGDTVNVASRLEGMNKELGSLVLISETTYLAAVAFGAQLQAEPVGEVTVRGRAQPIRVFKVLGVDDLTVPDIVSGAVPRK